MRYTFANSLLSTAIFLTTNVPGNRFISRPTKNRTGKTKKRASPRGTNSKTNFSKDAWGAGPAA